MTPERETIDWIFDSTAWWLENFGGFPHFAAATSLIVPTEDDFPVDLELAGHELAEDYFEFVKEHARLNEWPFQLVQVRTANVADALDGIPHHLTSPPTSVEEPNEIADGEPLTIPYELSQLADPIDLVATMARGVSHYLLYNAPAASPGEPDEHEYYVDLGAVLLGFGVFLANSAFRFQQTTKGMMIGWGFSRRGALSELDVSYALALTATLLEVRDNEIVPHLTPNPKSFFKSGRKHLQKKRKKDLDRLRAIPPPADGPYR